MKTKTSKNVFIFDLDDLLIWNEYTYSLAFQKFYSFLMKLWKRRIPFIGTVATLSEEITAKMVKKINPQTGKPYGFAMERFPTSLVRCYQILCEQGFGEFRKDIADKIYELGMTTFDERNYQRHGLVPFAKYVLRFLKKKRDLLILVTKGDPRVQERKINALKLQSWFGSEIHIVESKTPNLFLNFRNRFPGQKIFSVGNSFSDIKPALEAGIKGIYIPYESWKLEKEGSKDYDSSMVFTLKSIKEIVSLYKSGNLDSKKES